MTRLYPVTNGTPPNTWRDNIIVWPMSVVIWFVIAILLVLLFVEASGPRRRA